MAKGMNLEEKNAGQIVIVEDENESRKVMALALRKKGYFVEDFDGGEDALAYIRDHLTEIDLVITDLRMPGTDGLTVLSETKKMNHEINVLLVTGFGSVENAVEAMKLGADDYLTKPIDLFEFRTRVSKLIKSTSLNREVDQLHERLDKHFGFEEIIGKSEKMEDLFDRVRMVSGTQASVLLLGESGTGKELIANAIHQNSKKKSNRFLAINCAAIPSDILESELFGHERGAFTGAITRKIGKFELASSGTIFLDEIGDMSMDLQVKLLRVLENREFMRVGGSETVKINSRFIFATNKNLEKAIEEKTFREDLYYRINVITLRIPPLRERKTDIPLLAHFYLEKLAEEHEKTVNEIHPNLMDALVEYSWPGNVRELRNVIENLVVFCRNGKLSKSDLAPSFFSKPNQRDLKIPAGTTMDDLEKTAIYQTLEHVGGNKTKAAEILKIGLRTLQRKLKDYEEGSRNQPEED
jgi:DNA-binding NtrC family response regulator